MKKIVIITNGAQVRAFRFSDRLRGKDLTFHCTEIRSAGPAGATEEPQDAGLSEIAGQVSEIMAEEDPFFWILAAPRDLLTPLLHRVDLNDRKRLTHTVAGNLIENSLTEIANRFPPRAFHRAASVRPPAKRPKRPADAGLVAEPGLRRSPSPSSM